MVQLIVVAHVLAALGIIGLVLLQQGKGASMGASFGAGSSQTLFGSQGGGTALTRGTTLLVILFFATSFGLAVVAKSQANQWGDAAIPVPVVPQETIQADIGDMPASTPVEQPADMPADSAGDPTGDLPSQ